MRETKEDWDGWRNQIKKEEQKEKGAEQNFLKLGMKKKRMKPEQTTGFFRTNATGSRKRHWNEEW